MMQNDLISKSELLEKLNDTGVEITFDLPVEEILGEDVDIDDFAMLVQDAIQAYRKMIISTIQAQPTAYDVEKVVSKKVGDKAYHVIEDHMAKPPIYISEHIIQDVSAKAVYFADDWWNLEEMNKINAFLDKEAAEKRVEELKERKHDGE